MAGTHVLVQKNGLWCATSFSIVRYLKNCLQPTVLIEPLLTTSCFPLYNLCYINNSVHNLEYMYNPCVQPHVHGKPLCWTTLVLNNSCVEQLLCWTTPVLNNSCVEQLLCWTAVVLKNSCVEQLLCWTTPVLNNP